MRFLLVASLLFSTSPLNAAPTAKSVRKPVEAAICASLTRDYENGSKKLAMLKVEGVLDNSAMRATMRESQSNNILAQSRITMDLLKNNGCKGPTAAPSADHYLVAAMSCINARLGQDNDAAWARLDGKTAKTPKPLVECDQSNWTAN